MRLERRASRGGTSEAEASRPHNAAQPRSLALVHRRQDVRLKNPESSQGRQNEHRIQKKSCV